jgi:hypothetical protein
MWTEIAASDGEETSLGRRRPQVNNTEAHGCALREHDAIVGVDGLQQPAGQGLPRLPNERSLRDDHAEHTL